MRRTYRPDSNMRLSSVLAADHMTLRCDRYVLCSAAILRARFEGKKGVLGVGHSRRSDSANAQI